VNTIAGTIADQVGNTMTNFVPAVNLNARALVVNTSSAVVLSVTPTPFATSSTTHNVVMPTTVVTGDLLIILFSNNGSSTVTTPTNWSLLFSTPYSTLVRLSAYAKIALGTEGGTLVNLLTSAAQLGAAHVYRIQVGTWSGSLLDVLYGTAATGASTSPNPPSLSASWGAANNLFIAVEASQHTDVVSAYPTTYIDGFNTVGGTGTAAAGIGSARKISTLVSDDPGVFTLALTEEWVANTLVIKNELSDIISPIVTITLPTSVPTYSVTTTPITISGIASDNIGVSKVEWDTGSTKTLCTGTADWSCSGIPLTFGTNVITITASDAKTNIGTDVITVSYTGISTVNGIRTQGSATK
jgi:hypothetical protein